MVRELSYDAHVYTSLSWGESAPEVCVRAAEAAGLVAVALTDHYHLEDSQVAPRLAAYTRAAAGSPVRVVAGAECDILDPAGRLSLAEAGRASFPLVLARLSAHTEGVAQAVPARLEALLQNLREALVNACRRPGVNVLAVPFSLGQFPAALAPEQIPPSLLEEVGGVMREQGVAFEIGNGIWTGYPELSLEEFTEQYARLVMAFSGEGVKFLVGSEARCPGAVGSLRYAERIIAAARLERSQFVDLTRLRAVN